MSDASADSAVETLETERQLIQDAKARGPLATLGVFARLSGPGWLQSAITLGGGSLGGSLYLGVLAGFSLMWLQPLAMVLGVVMLSAIAYVTLSTGRRPFQAINEEINPVLGWSWLIATVLANMVWVMPQFSLGTAAASQNLLGYAPGSQQAEGVEWPILLGLAIVAFGIVWSYNSGGKGIKLFEILLKVLVGIVVVSFFGVVIRMTFSAQGLPWGEILAGFIPGSNSFGTIPNPLKEAAAATGEFAVFWEGQAKGPLDKTMLTAAATAVGINMTFLLPYSMLKKRWDRDFRGLAIFDLATGLVIPYVLATSCVVIASASQFHAQPAAGVFADVDAANPAISASPDAKPASKGIVGGVNGLLDSRLKEGLGADAFNDRFGKDPAKRTDAQKADLDAARAALPMNDRRMAAILVNRDAFELSGSLENLMGRTFGDIIFGIGVLAMAVSTIIILMLINGFAICEMLGKPGNTALFRIGCALVAISGVCGAGILWKGAAKAWLVVPTSMFGFALLPIAYITFFFMMNSRQLLGEHMPQGGNRLKWNALMLVAISFAVIGSTVSIQKSDFPLVGFGIVGGIIVLAVIVHFMRGNPLGGSTESNRGS